MIAIDAVYHLKCLTTFYNRHRSQHRYSTEKSHEIIAEALAFAEVVSHIEEYAFLDGDRSHIFKLNDLKTVYTESLKRLGGVTDRNIHSTRFTQKLLHHIPDLEAHNSNFGTVLAFKDDIGDALIDACHPDPDDEAVMLMRVAKLVRREVLQKKYRFRGSLCDEQYDDLPTSLSVLVELILGGPNAGQHINDNEISTAASSITQLLVFNAIKRGRKESVAIRHNSERETVLPLYLGLLIHNKTRKRDLIDILFEKGLSVSYDRVLQLSTDEANKVIDMYDKEGTVCPGTLRDNLFTTGNLDNIDHNPSSTTSRDSFHGTAISITQHITNDNPGIVRVCETITEDRSQQKQKSIRSLPKLYTDVPPVSLPVNLVPAVTDEQAIPAPMDEDRTLIPWFENVTTLLMNENVTDTLRNDISWSSYFASLQTSVPKPPAIIALLPLFRDIAHSPAMVKHGMDIIQQITFRHNSDQIPVLTVDQPLYAIAKRIQWKWPEEYGERQYLIMMGGLHIEMALLKVIGDWLDGSGWSYVMTSANVTTEGRASSLQKGLHISRGQWAHQITAAALFILLQRSYVEYRKNTPDDTQIDFNMWCHKMALMHPQFDYWFKVWKLEVLFLQFLRSQRQPNFVSYIDSLRKIIPWMFALDHFHYSRWMTIHVKDLLALEINSPVTYEEFLQGNFVTQKSTHKFSALAHDQVHEQLIAMVKGDGGAIGITENDVALTRWMVAGPETARLLMEYDEKHSKKKYTDRHHEQIPSVQKAFLSQVKNVIDVMEELGNPFSDTGADLYMLDTKRIMPDSVVNTIRTAENIGITQYQLFVTERINGNNTSFNDTIHKNNLPLFNSSSGKKSAKSASKISSLCDDVNLFSRMYISCQARNSDMDAFFKHENHAWPPSLASNGIMHQSTKSDLMECLESLAPKPECEPNVNAKIVDGAALVHLLDPIKSKETVKTFHNYSQLMFLPYLERMLQDVTRLDVVWDVYKKDSLKSQTRKNRRTGNHILVANNTRIPSNWKNFLQCDSNKESLFQLLADAICELQSSKTQGKQIISTKGKGAVSSSSATLNELSCTHEEADTRLLYHASHAFHQGFTKVLIHATDTDVVVLAVAVSSILSDCEIWVAFGHGSKLRYIPCHLISAELGRDASWGLLFMHAISGCDTVSAFFGIGKKTAWAVWRSMPQLTPTFIRLSRFPTHVTLEDMDQIERYTVLLYQRTSGLNHVNEARKHLFTQNRKMENIPPTLNALEQHVKRAVYQAGYIWGQTLIGDPNIPSPELWGWKKGRDASPWTPCWTTIPEAAKACQELLKCGCKKECNKRCKCAKANLPCTQLCLCSGQCDREL